MSTTADMDLVRDALQELEGRGHLGPAGVRPQTLLLLAEIIASALHERSQVTADATGLRDAINYANLLMDELEDIDDNHSANELRLLRHSRALPIPQEHMP